MTKVYRFDDRVALVTGAGMGLGKAHAFELARRGAKIIVNDFNREAAESSATEINAAFGDVAITAVEDVSREAGARSIVDIALNKFGRIDIVVNNAGTASYGEFLETPRSEYDRIMDINVRGTWEVTRAAWPHMTERKYGRVLMTTSGAGLYGQAAGAEYSASKAADYGLAMSLAAEGAEHGIHVNTLAPVAWTPLSDKLTPEGAREWFRTLKPEAVSQLVAWLVHEDCPSNGEAWGALRGVVVRYKMASRIFSQEGFQVEDIARAADELSAFTGNCDFDADLSAHLVSLAGKSSSSVDAAAFGVEQMIH